MPRLNPWTQLSLAIATVICLTGLATADEPADFTVVLLADTQFYSESYPENYLSQTEWIKDRVDPDNIKFVIHLGDIVQNPTVEKEWQNADQAQRLLDKVVPYSMLPGNHDMDGRDTSLYNKYFPASRFEGNCWYGGHLGDTNDNNYCTFKAGGMDFLVLSLEYEPRAETLQWANQVVASHKRHRVIVATHRYLDRKVRNSCGERILDKLVKKHENVFLVVCGHVLGVNHLTATNDAGGTVHEILSDYQGLPKGGNGWLRTLRFVPGEGKIHVQAYSPLLDEYNKAPEHTFTIEYEMKPAQLKKAG